MLPVLPKKKGKLVSLEIDFIRESNKIEGINRNPTQEEIDEFNRFMDLKSVTVKELQRFVSVYQPDARLRDVYGLNVRVGNYYPPFGGPEIYPALEAILNLQNSFEQHISYEKLHPFTDGNGRSGRALWAWNHRDLSLGFLHRFYYDTLNHFSHKKL